MGRTVPAVDNARVVNLFGVSVTPWRKSVEDGVDGLLKVEKEWREAGVDPSVLQNNEVKCGFLAIWEMVSKAMSQAQV